MSVTLLVLAAGMGSRYGGLKQLDPLGPSGETLMDYSSPLHRSNPSASFFLPYINLLPSPAVSSVGDLM